MNQSLKKAFIISASALLFLSAGAGINNVQARRYHYRYHRRVNRNKYGVWKHYRKHGRTRSYFVRYKTGYFHNGRWIRYKSNKSRRGHRRVRRARSYYRTQARRRAQATAKRRRDAFTRHHIDIILNAAKPKSRHVHHYHILVDGVDDGWTTNYRTYKNSVNEIKKEIQQKEQQLSDQQSQQADTDDDTQSDKGVGVGTTPSLTRFAKEMQARTIQDINNDREANGLQPYTESPQLDKVAQIRAEQQPFSHFNSQGQVENGVIAQQLGYLPVGPDNYYSENLSTDFIGKNEPGTEGTTSDNSTPTKAADSNDNDLMNYDQENNNGHRENILATDSSNVGVGVYCSKDNYNRPQYYLAEEFY